MRGKEEKKKGREKEEKKRRKGGKKMGTKSQKKKKKIPRTTITGVIDRFRKRGNVENIQRLGAPAKLSRRDTRAILHSAKINRKRSLSDTTFQPAQGGYSFKTYCSKKIVQ